MNIEEPRYFSWIKVNEIAGCNHPKSNAELQWLKNQDIKHILCLSKDHYPNGAEIVGFQVELIHINEFEGPPENVMKQLLSYLTNVRSKRESLVVHCRMGWGRTGVVLAMYLMAFYGKTAKQAIQEVRSQRPHSIETAKQEESLHQFQEVLLQKSGRG